MRSWLLRCWGLFLVALAGCDGVLADYSDTRCNADGSCIAGYHCVRETWRCQLGPVDESVCAITTCFNADGCCPQGCHANNDSDCPSVCGNSQLEPGEQCDDGNTTHEDDCPNTCQPNVCGDGAIDRQEPRTETCDDGNTLTEQECAYGTRTCKQCNASCTEALNLTGRYCGDGLQNGPGEQCDDGNASNQDNCLDTCVRATCGDGFINTVSTEACDDGNTVNENSCPYGTPNCTRCNATCSATLNLSGAYCGDNLVSNGEACDDGNTITETSCPYGPASCTSCNATCSAKVNLSGPYCGDNKVTDGEVCDDGNTVNEISCPYGTKICTPCNSTCTGTLTRTGNFCGDNIVSDGEVCDDGNTVTETSCPYGSASCTRCDATCGATLNLTGPTCGDRLVNGPEVCDDGNTNACGTCNTSCSAVQLSRATGRIFISPSSTGNDFKDAETFTLNDGLNPPTSFEFDKNSVTTSGRTPIFVQNVYTAAQLATVIADAINGVSTPLAITAGATADGVNLTHDQAGAFGNQSISDTVVSTRFNATPMSGGSGFDCSAGIGCTRPEDCEPGLACLSNGTCGVPP